MKSLGLLFLVPLASFVLLTSYSHAQDDTDKLEAVRQRANLILQTAREKKWDEMYKFSVVVTGQRDEETRRRMGISENADESEIKKKVAAHFRPVWELPPPGEILKIRFKEKDRTIALIEYRHEDRDGFNMVQIDGEWYHTLQS